jgi:hypothetical protein
LLALISLGVGLAALYDAVFGEAVLASRILLGVMGGAIIVVNLMLRAADIRALFTPPLAATRGGYSYGEVRRRMMVQLRWTIRSILALISLFVIAQVLIGFLIFAGSSLTMAAVEITLWSGVALGLHLGWRTWMLLRLLGNQRFELG